MKGLAQTPGLFGMDSLLINALCQEEPRFYFPLCKETRLIPACLPATLV